MVVRVDLNISLDGFGTTTDQTPENPFGTDWGRLVGAYVATRTVQAKVFGKTDGSGTTGVDEKYAAAYFDGVGAEVMGAGMFGLHQPGVGTDWSRWWGDEPPFGYPVLVLTHEDRPSIEFANGTAFHFASSGIEEALARATAMADGGDVRVGGGITVAREYLAAGLVDRLHVAITPILLGGGENLWQDLRGLEQGYSVSSETAESGVAHLTFTR